jgi:DNA-binding cell septation regulator SpoVG
MKVTKVWVNKYKSGKLLGFANIQFSLDNSDDGHMRIDGFKLFEGDDGIQIGLPSKKDESGKLDDKTGKVAWHPVMSIPISEEKPNEVGAKFKEYLRKEVTKAYNALEEKKAPAEKVGQDFVGSDDIPF